MVSPTDLSTTIAEALIQSYGERREAGVFVDEQSNQLVYARFDDGSSYTVRIEPRKDG